MSNVISDNGWLYLTYNERCKDCFSVRKGGNTRPTMVVFVRGRLQGNIWVDSEVLWHAPKENYLHGVDTWVGARIAFDSIGYVYFTVGGKGEKEDAQRLDRPSGKVYRLHEDSRILENNPFVDRDKALAATQTLLFEGLGRIRDLEQGVDGAIYLLLERNKITTLAKLVAAD